MLRHGVECAGESEKHRNSGCDGEKERAVGKVVVALEVDGERDRG